MLIHWRAYLALCLANATEALEVLSASYLLQQLTDDAAARSALATAVFIGMLAGGLTSGPMVDWLGSAIVLQGAMLFAGGVTAAVAAAPNLAFVVTARTLSGFAVGLSTPPIFALAVELAPAGCSGKAVSCVASFWMVGRG